MKKLILFISFSVLLIIGFTQNDPEEIYQKYIANLLNIERLSYEVNRIDTLVSGEVRNHMGFAILKRKVDDPLFGYFFWGHCYDTYQQIIYDGKHSARIEGDQMRIYVEAPKSSSLKTSGGQMVHEELIYPTRDYLSIHVWEKKNSWVIQMDFPDDSIHKASNRQKSIEIDKITWLPVRISENYEVRHNKVSLLLLFSDFQINDDAADLLKNENVEVGNYYKYLLASRARTNLINKPLMSTHLKDLFTEESFTLPLNTDKPILIDFWEVWCRPCVKSLGKIDHLYQKYGEKIEIVGIVTEKPEKAKKLSQNKGLHFPIMLGGKILYENFGITGVPRYFLVNREGIIIKDYKSFSDEIEKDILALIK